MGFFELKIEVWNFWVAKRRLKYGIFGIGKAKKNKCYIFQFIGIQE